ncbi:MAG TPA: hypothetical protein VFN18_02320 [Solirubrobacterales bacterium]|nr:hypothetical protein [Solirubrobacterales bacterium]
MAGRLQKPAIALVGLAVAMLAAATWLLLAGNGNVLHGDELFYFSHIVDKSGGQVRVDGLEYLFAPHNGHLVILGRLFYELLFALFGTGYFWFRAAEVLGVLICSGLFFALAWRRTSPPIALAFTLPLLTLGYANEVLMWPFDLHTLYSAALGLGAFLALERDDQRGDVLTAVLLVLSVAMLEVGVAFAVGVGVSILLRDDRRRRLWIVGAPIFLYGIWWLWAQKFDQSGILLSNVRLIPFEVANALTAVVGSVTGLNPTAGAAPPEVTTITPVPAVAAGFAVAGLIYRIRRGAVPPSLWMFLATALAYWVTMAMGGRAPDGTRYVYVGTVLVLLVAVDAIRGIRFSPLATLAFFAVFLVALPSNVQKLNDGRSTELKSAKILDTEFAMLDLARGHVARTYMPMSDPRVEEAGGHQGVGLHAGDYFRGVDRNGSLGIPLDRLRGESLELRGIADAALVGALDLSLQPASAPVNRASCTKVRDASPASPAYFELPGGGVLLGATRATAPIGLSRFTDGKASVPVGQVPAGRWGALRIPADSAADSWLAVVVAPVYACPLP